MKVTLKYKLTELTRLLISADYREFETYIWHIRHRVILKDIFTKKKVRLLSHQNGSSKNSVSVERTSLSMFSTGDDSQPFHP